VVEVALSLCEQNLKALCVSGNGDGRAL